MATPETRMTNPKRYDLVDQGDSTLTERPDGDYELHDDAQAEREVLRGNLSLAEEGLANAMQEIQRHQQLRLEGSAYIAGLQQEIQRLQAALDAETPSIEVVYEPGENDDK